MKHLLSFGPSRRRTRHAAFAVGLGSWVVGVALTARGQVVPNTASPGVDAASSGTAAVVPNSTGSATGSPTAQNAVLGGNAAVVQKADQTPIEISSNSQTTYRSTPEGRVATFTGAVNIVTNDASIYCDQADYNADTHEGLLTGGVRIFRNDTVLTAERAVYNFNTKAIRALDFGGEKPPFEFSSIGVFSPGQGLQYNLRNSVFTTDDRSNPDFHLSSRRVRIYPDNRIIYVGSTLYVGSTPVFYFPYFYQSLDQQSGYTLTPGYSSVYGAYLLTGITFPVSDHVTGLVRLDYRSTRGVAGGLNFQYKPNKKKKVPPSGSVSPYASDDDDGAASAVVTAPTTSPNNAPGTSSNVPAGGFGASVGTLGAGANTNPDETARPGFAATGEGLSRQIRNKEASSLLTYFVDDDKPDLNRTTLNRELIGKDRYRIKLSTYQFFTDDFYFKADIDKISDRYLLQDFYEGEFTKNPNPENVVSLTYIQPSWITTLTARYQPNEFFDSTERLPELAFEAPRTPLANTGIFYETSNTLGYLHRSFDNATPLPEYSTVRADTFHQFSLPETYFGWLNFDPRIGLRGTYYSRSAPSNTSAYALQFANDTNAQSILDTTTTSTDLQLKNAQDLRNQIAAFKTEGDIVRPVLNAGFDLSFKLSRVYDDVESRTFGLDRLQHIVQPYVDFQFVEDFGYGSRRLLQFDRLLPTTQLQPIDFPQFTSIDTIDENTAVRVGVRNRLQTKRDALTFNWLELDTFFQANIYQPDQVATFANTNTTFSNLFNQFTFRPLPWVNLTIDSQLPAFTGKKGFTEVDTALQFQATSNLDFTISHRYLNNNPFFQNSSLLRLNVYYRLDDNWAAGFSERYEFAQHILQAQSYTLYRDLSSFVASFGVTVRNNNGIQDYGVVLNFTLKGVPKVSLPVGFDVNALDPGGSP